MRRAPVGAQGTGAARSIDNPVGRTAAARRLARKSPAQAALRRRRNPRLPTCSTAPSSRSGARSRSSAPSAAPSSFTAPCASLRRASEREPPKLVGDQRRHVHRRAVLRRERRLLDLLGHVALHEDALEVRGGVARRRLGVQPLHEPSRERVLGVARRQALRQRLAEQQLVPAGHRRVGQAQRLAVHLLRRIRDPDVVAQRLGHLAHAVDARQDRHRQRDLLRDPVRALHVAARAGG